MNDEQIKQAEQMQINLAMREKAIREKKTDVLQLRETTMLDQEKHHHQELRSRQQRMIAQNLINVVDDQDVIFRVHKSLVLAYVKQMNLTFITPKRRGK